MDNIKATLHVLTKVLKGDLNATAENIHVLEEIKDSVVPVEWIKPPYQSAHSLWSFFKPAGRVFSVNGFSAVTLK